MARARASYIQGQSPLLKTGRRTVIRGLHDQNQNITAPRPSGSGTACRVLRLEFKGRCWWREKRHSAVACPAPQTEEVAARRKGWSNSPRRGHDEGSMWPSSPSQAPVVPRCRVASLTRLTANPFGRDRPNLVIGNGPLVPPSERLGMPVAVSKMRRRRPFAALHGSRPQRGRLSCGHRRRMEQRVDAAVDFQIGRWLSYADIASANPCRMLSGPISYPPRSTSRSTRATRLTTASSCWPRTRRSNPDHTSSTSRAYVFLPFRNA